MKKIFFGIVGALLLFGCAAQEKPKQETVFYPMPPVQPRLQFLVSINSEEDIGKKQSAFDEFLLGKLPPLKKIDRPYDMGAVNGAIYISDRTHKKILMLDLKKKAFDYIKSTGLGAIVEPAGIWVAEDGLKYVADFSRKQIVVFDKENNYLRAYGENDQFNKPLDVAVYKNKVYVCDFGLHQIIVLDRDSGKVIQTIGKAGEKEGDIYKPTHITVDRNGNLYVNDSFNFRIQKFDQEGRVVKVFGFHGDATGAFARPKGVAIDDERHLYAVDAAFENVQIFDDETAKVLLFFGGFGPNPGDMYLPGGIYIDYNYDNVEYFRKYEDKDFRIKYLIYVGNMLGENKLNVYGFGDWVGAPMPVK